VAGYRELLSLTEEQRKELSGWAQSRTLPAGDVFRARLILALTDGLTYQAIKSNLQTTAPTIWRWKQSFEEWGIEGLEPQHKGSKPRTANTGPCKPRSAGRCNRKHTTAVLTAPYANWPRNRYQSVERAPHPVASPATAAPAGALPDE